MTGFFDGTVAIEALMRLLKIASRDTGQSRRVADFLLAWYNGEANGKWDPTDLWGVDEAIADDMLLVLQLIRHVHKYPNDIGFGKEITRVWELWRGDRVPLDPTTLERGGLRRL